MTSDDCDLLMRAATGAGFNIRWAESDALRVSDPSSGWAARWNPLIDDGDALRLAVKLRLTVCPDELIVEVGHAHTPGPMRRERYGGDPYASTRRAIVRAAAALCQSNTK